MDFSILILFYFLNRDSSHDYGKFIIKMAEFNVIWYQPGYYLQLPYTGAYGATI